MLFTRPLNPIEKALTLSNERQPLCGVIVMKIEPVPPKEVCLVAAQTLQERFPLLQCHIIRTRKKYRFVPLSPFPGIPVVFHKRRVATDWQSIAKLRLNTSYPARQPLIQLDIMTAAAEQPGEIILTFHHALMDSNGARMILDELLLLLAGESLPVRDLHHISTAGWAEFRPPRFRQLLFNYLKSQGREGMNHRKHGFINKSPIDPQNGILFLRFDQDISTQIREACVSEQLDLNNLLLAALTLTTIRHKYPHQRHGLARVVNFANISSSLSSIPEPEQLGCYISMLRFCIPVSHNDDLSAIARSIRKSIRSSRRNNEVLLMAWLSQYLVPLSFSIRNMRLGVSALSFIGNLPLSKHYGNIALKDVHAFITNNATGPEFSAFGKVLHGCIGLDFNYLAAETTQAEAEAIVSTFETLLHDWLKFRKFQ